jgi:hypothetical protein
MAFSFGIGEANRKIKRFGSTDCDYMASREGGQSRCGDGKLQRDFGARLNYLK